MDGLRRSLTAFTVVVATLLVSAGLVVTVAPTIARAASIDVAGMTTTPVLTDIPGTPVNAKFAPDGRIFVALKEGKVLVYDGPGDVTPDTVVDLDVGGDVMSFADRGLLGMALDPAFASGKPYLYLLYTYDRDPFGVDAGRPRWGDVCPYPPGGTTDGCTVSARVDRYTLDAAGHATGAPVRLLDGVGGALGGWCNQFDSHSIGTLAFGADGMLYVGAGDGASYVNADFGQFGGSLAGTPTPPNPCNDKQGTAPRTGGRGTPLTSGTARGGAVRSQAVRDAQAAEYVSWDGAILRVDPNSGNAAPGNPLATNRVAGDDRIVAYGLRNPYRFSLKPGTNEVWLGDVGWNTWEEIDTFTSGAARTTVPNFGWPCYEGMAKQQNYDGLDISLCETLYANPTQSIDGVSSPLTWPIYTWSRYGTAGQLPCGANGGGGASIGGQFAANSKWPAAIRNGYVFGDSARGCIAVVPLKADGSPDPTAVRSLVSGVVPVDIEVGPEGDIYWIDYVTHSLMRIRPLSGNLAPIASFVATPAAGPVPLDVLFDATTTTDPNPGEVLTYTWDFGDVGSDGVCSAAEGSGALVRHRYATRGVYTAKLCVTDSLGATSTAARQIQPGNAAPVITSFTTSADAGGFAVGDPISFAATATDDTGVLPPSAYTWKLEQRHCQSATGSVCHTHPLTTPPGGATGAFVAPDHDYYAYLQLTLTVTDAGGLTATRVKDIRPRLSTVTLATEPPGASVSLGGTAGASPLSAPFLEGGTAQLVAPPGATVAGAAAPFSGWADAPSAPSTRTLVVAPGASTYNACYGTSPLDAGSGPVPAFASATAAPAEIDSRVSTRVDVTAVVAGGTGARVVSAVVTGPDGSRSTAKLIAHCGGTWSGALDIPANAPPGAYAVTLNTTDSAGHAASTSAGNVQVVWAQVGPPPLPFGGFTPIEPLRVLDTRNGTGVPAGRLQPNVPVRLQVAGAAGIDPAASGVVVNVTAVDPAAPGYVSAYPCGDPPVVSNLNLTTGETSANLATVLLDASGGVCFVASQEIDLVADVTAVVVAGGSRYTGIDPVRAVDTRTGLGLAPATIPAGTAVRIPLAATGVPAGATGVVATMTVVDPGSAGYLTAFPCASGPPLASNLNFRTGQTVSNLVMTDVDDTGGLCVISNATLHLVVDVSGWLSSAGSQPALAAPHRVLDTRQTTALGVGDALQLPASVFAAPATASAVVVNVTAVDPAAAGFLTIAPCEAATAATSNVNFRRGETRPVLALVRLGASRTVCVHASQPMNVVIDVQGFLVG